ncbi:MAG: serine/threonine protein kinase, partial [Planctomycetes bacterium]|nr:serine/threonine protein kinase [Planctomycetota bacterium]
MNPRDIEQQEDVLVRLMADYDEALADDAPTTGVDESAAEFDPQLAAAWAGAKECLELLDRARRSGGLTSSRLEPSDGAPPPAVAPPQRLGRFVLERELGRGGLGIVYLAHDPQLGRQVALKIPRFEAMLDDDLRRRFLREAEAAARLNHPNLVALHEVGEESSICYLASEYCPGPTLAEWLHEREDRVPLRQAAEIMLALAEAVEHAHSRGVLHRDIKPSNVLLVASGDDAEGGHWSPKLTDFGLAKLLEQEGGDKTRIGALIGTLAYMAPEQAEGRVDDLDARTDVYALGAVLYELLAGVAPYGGQTDVDTLRQLIMHEPVAPRKLRPNVPRDLEAITLKCLARNPAARYATAHGLVADLRRFLEGQPTVARPLSLLEHALKWARRRPAAAALLVGACILPAFLIGGALWVNQRLAQSLREAQTAHQQAKTQARFTLEHVYASDMATAQQAWMEGNLTGTAAILARFEPTSDQADVRNVEWHYLTQLLDGASRVLPGHKGWLAALAYSPDGRWLVSGGNDGIVHLRDSSNRKTRHLWKLRHGDHVNALAFSPDSQRLAAATEEGLVRRWDVVSGSELAALHGHAGWVADVSFSPDGRQIASAGSDHTVRLWDAASGEAAAVLRGHRDIVRKVRFILDGSVVVATSEDQTVRLWRAADGEPIAEESFDLTAKQFGARPTDMAISPDGQTLAVCVTSEFVRLWRIDAPGRLERFADIPHDQVRCVAFSADGRRLLFGTNDCQLSEWDLQQRELTTVRRGHKRPILVLAVAPRGDEVASGSRDGELRLWGDDSGQASRSIARFPFNCQRSELDPSNDLWAIGTSTGQI